MATNPAVPPVIHRKPEAERTRNSQKQAASNDERQLQKRSINTTKVLMPTTATYYTLRIPKGQGDNRILKSLGDLPSLHIKYETHI